jgi:hypothetical protein
MAARRQARKPFTPIGNVSEADLVEQELMACPPGGTVEYADLDRVLGRPFRDNRSPYYTALRRVEKHGQRTFIAVDGQGYRRVDPNEHVTVGKQHERKARRQVSKAASKYRSAERSSLTNEERQELDAATTAVKRMGQFMRRTGKRLDALEKQVSSEALEEAIRRVVERMMHS